MDKEEVPTICVALKNAANTTGVPKSIYSIFLMLLVPSVHNEPISPNFSLCEVTICFSNPEASRAFYGFSTSSRLHYSSPPRSSAFLPASCKNMCANTCLCTARHWHILRRQYRHTLDHRHWVQLHLPRPLLLETVILLKSLSHPSKILTRAKWNL